MKKSEAVIMAAVLSLILGCVSERVRRTADIPRITIEQLKSMVGSQDVIIIDVRTKEQWTYSNRRIPGAAYGNPNDVESWAGKYPKGKTVVLY